MLLKSFLLIILALPAAYIIYLSPVYKSLDCPNNNYGIGTTFRYIKETADPGNTLSETLPQKPRELMLQVWYPTSKIQTGNRVPYLENYLPIVKSALQAKTHLPNVIIDKLLNIETCSTLNSPFSNEIDSYPVIIFASPGYNTRQIEYIASNGYIVVGIFDAYVLPDGTIKKDELQGDDFSFERLNEHVKNIKFTFDYLNELNQDDNILKNKLNLDSVAFMGHSFYGVAALNACRQDKRCKAAINLDGSLSFDPNPDQPISKPVLMLLQDYERESFLAKRLKNEKTTKEEYLNYKYSSVLQLCKSPNDPVYAILIKNAGHDSFSDSLFFKYPLASLWGFDIGEDDPYKLFRIINKYIVSFLDKYLKDKPVTLPSKCKINIVN